ncbi:hypothetical protein [Isoptericola sp. NPDC060282]|uniref:hypothetical protein n=1 Tax=unclassified Isoptericola TaxID=2623355 RepID=UPI00365B7019
MTPIKGGAFESRLHAIMHDVAAGLGDAYDDTTTAVGALPNSKKGDGVLAVTGEDANVVLEMTDSTRKGWSDYLEMAERNRRAQASLGIVRTVEQNAGQSVRVLGPRRVVLAFDPDVDEPDLLRTVVLLLRTVAITSARSTGGGAEIVAAQERVTAAIEHLEKLDAIKKSAAAITKQAASIESGCTLVTGGIRRLLDEALAALAGTGTDTPDAPSVEHAA